MPSIAMFRISPPSDPAEFENICMDYLAHKYNGEASLYGRRGQSQQGIDIIVTLKDNSFVCCQCKDVKNVSQEDIKKWIKKVDDECKIQMKEFVIIVAIENDAKLQEQICSIAKCRMDESKSPVKLIFWDDVVHFIKKDSNMLRMYYPFLYDGQMVKIEEAIKTPEMKYPERIKGVNRLWNLFFDETVKFRIEEFLNSSPLNGVDFELVCFADACIYSLMKLLYRAPTLSAEGLYYDIEQFLTCFCEYCDFLPDVSETKGKKVYATNTYHTTVEEKDIERCEELRKKALEKYIVIKDFCF